MEVDHADVAKFRCTCNERVEQDRGHGRGALEVNLLARADVGDGLRGSDDPWALGHDLQGPVSIRCFATKAAAWARRSRLSFERIELT